VSGTTRPNPCVQVEDVKQLRCKQLRARLATRGGRISPSACICRWADRTCLFSAIFKN